MQRTFYPKHVTYFGNGSGRDQQVIVNDAGLNKGIGRVMGSQGV